MTNREKTSVGEKHVPGLTGGKKKPCFRENFVFMEPGQLKSSPLAVPQSRGAAASQASPSERPQFVH